jgi:hypothetical protein
MVEAYFENWRLGLVYGHYGVTLRDIPFAGRIKTEDEMLDDWKRSFERSLLDSISADGCVPIR